MPRWPEGNRGDGIPGRTNTGVVPASPMASERCSKCGAFGPAGTAYCAFCGTPFRGQGAGAPLAAGAPPTTFGPPSPGPSGRYPALGTTGAPSVPSPEARSAERRALTYVIWGAILILVAGAFSVGADLTTTVSGGALHLGTPFLLASLGAGACEFLVVVLFYLAFRSLAARDPAFSTPSRLALLLSVAIALLLAALYPLVTMLNQLETCITSAGQQPDSPGGLHLGRVVRGDPGSRSGRRHPRPRRVHRPLDWGLASRRPVPQ